MILTDRLKEDTQRLNQRFITEGIEWWDKNNPLINCFEGFIQLYVSERWNDLIRRN